MQRPRQAHKRSHLARARLQCGAGSCDQFSDDVAQRWRLAGAEKEGRACSSWRGGWSARCSAPNVIARQGTQIESVQAILGPGGQRRHESGGMRAAAWRRRWHVGGRPCSQMHQPGSLQCTQSATRLRSRYKTVASGLHQGSTGRCPGRRRQAAAAHVPRQPHTSRQSSCRGLGPYRRAGRGSV